MSGCRLVSIDSSTSKTGMALFDSGKLVDYVLIDKSKDDDVDSRLDNMCRDILLKLEDYQPELIYIEHPQGEGRNVRVVGMLCEIIGAVRAYAIQHNAEIKEVLPSQWRSWFGMNQGGKKRSELKRMSVEHVNDRFGIKVGNDIADAICIGIGVLNKLG